MFQKKRRKRRYRRMKVTKRAYIVAKRRLQPWKNPRKAEVKHHTTFVNSQAIVSVYDATPAQSLYDRQILLNSTTTSGLLGKISQGTSKAQRIGGQIFVKKIVIKMYLWTCPPSAQTVYQDGVSMRVLITNTRAQYTGVGTYNIANYFRTAENIYMVAPPHRNKYNVYHDKIYYWRPQIGVRGSNAGDFMGYGRLIRITIPVNRMVTYDDTGEIKEDRDLFNIYAWGHIPQGTTDNKQLLCGNLTATTYYTDD